MVTGREIQVEEGEFTRIHNAILEVLAKVRLSGAEFRCIHFLLRKTYGWGKKEDRISLSQWADGTDSKRPHVLGVLNELIRKKIIYRRMEGGQVPIYGFNKYIEAWEEVGVDSERGKRFQKEELLPEQIPLPKKVTVTKAGNSTVTSTDNGTVTKAGTHKRKKETLKEIPPHQILFDALARICMVDPKLKGGQIGRTAKTLLGAGYTPSDVENFQAWWMVNDFRGRKNEPPTLANVLDKIPLAKKEMSPRQQITGQRVEIELPGGQVVEANA